MRWRGGTRSTMLPLPGAPPAGHARLPAGRLNREPDVVSEVAAFGRHNARLEPVPTALPPGDRPDPVSLLERQAVSRLPELLPIRYGRMAASPFAFFRGAALVMASDLADTEVSGLTVQTCGDAHLSNFGIFGSPERRLVFDISDFDE